MLDSHKTRTLTRFVALFAMLMAACDDGGGVNGADVGTSEGSLEDGGSVDADTIDQGDVADAEEVDILYPGYPCGGDDQCSTGLCYGLATPQGHFEQAKCQSLCIEIEDFHRYCDSDDDCCKGRCCVGCGAREGLCVLD